MDLATLKSEIKEIADIAASVPEQFRDKCFELLLQQLLKSNPTPGLHPQSRSETATKESSPPGADVGPRKDAGASNSIPVKAQLRVFMQRTGVTMEELQAIALVDGDDVHFIREPAHGTVAKGQMEWALLLSLKHAITENELSADPEDVRSICQEKGFYDKGNFAAIFKRQPYARYFRQPLQPQGPRQALTNDGQTALGELIKALAKRSE